MLTPGAFGEYTIRADDDPHYGTRMLVDGRTVYVAVKKDEHLEERIAFAKALVSRAPEIGAIFRQCQAVEAKRQPRFAAEILRLELELFVFNGRKTLALAEVSFTEESSRDEWFAAYMDGEFKDLQLER